MSVFVTIIRGSNSGELWAHNYYIVTCIVRQLGDFLTASAIRSFLRSTTIYGIGVWMYKLLCDATRDCCIQEQLTLLRT